MKVPPLLPEEAFDRTVRVANLDGMCVMVVAGMLALAAASVGDFQGAAVGLLVAAAGAIELHGVGLLRAGDARGMKWVIASQPYLFTVLIGYCAWRLATPDFSAFQSFINARVRERIAEVGITEDEFLRQLNALTFVVLGWVTLFYQGAMTIYYVRRKPAVVRALEQGAAERDGDDDA